MAAVTGPSTATEIICSPVGSCAYKSVDATAVVQKSTDCGKTWGPVIPMQPGFPPAGYDASVQDVRGAPDGPAAWGACPRTGAPDWQFIWVRRR
jgi:hypothetical protein